MKTMAISEFKTHALKILNQVSQTHESIVITKRGTPVAQITPYQNQISLNKPGQLKDALIFEGDIVSPLGEKMWEVCR